jgi:hypothetical protein
VVKTELCSKSHHIRPLDCTRESNCPELLLRTITLPRNSESQTRAAHRRFHEKRGIVKSTCAICRAEHPECGAVEINLGDEEVSQPTVILLQAPPKDLPPDIDQWQRDRIYRLSALNRSIEEVATALGMSVGTLSEVVISQFQCNYAKLSERASIEVQLEIESQIYERARAGDFRFTMLYSKLKGIPGFYEQPSNPHLLPPASMSQDLRSLSTEDLMKVRAGFLNAVIDRPGRFDTNGPISPTCTLVETDPKDRPTPVEWKPPIHPDSDEAIAKSKAAIISLGPTKINMVEPPKPTEKTPLQTSVQGPVIARPEAGMLMLRGRDA